MTKVLVTETYLEDIANAIRQKTGSANVLHPGDMAAAIAGIDTGYPEPAGTLVITENGAVNVKDYAAANVNVLPALQTKTATRNGTVAPDAGYDGLSSVEVNVQGGGISASIGVENGALTTDNVNVKSQPVIVDDQIGASSSAGLAFAFKDLKLQIDFDLTIRSGNSYIVFSFGGSNTVGGVYVIGPQQFHLYAGGARFNIPISLTEGVQYRARILMTSNSATLYVDGTQIAVGQSGNVANAIAYFLAGSEVALLFNQSKHSEYSNSLIDNVVIQLV